jgi:hypothetical protein
MKISPAAWDEQPHRAFILLDSRERWEHCDEKTFPNVSKR